MRWRIARAAWQPVIDVPADGVQKGEDGKPTLQEFAHRLAALGKILIRDGWKEQVDNVSAGSDSKLCANDVLKQALDGGQAAVLASLATALASPRPGFWQEVVEGLKWTLMVEVLGDPPRAVPPLGWEGEYVLPVESLADFVKWLDDELIIHEGYELVPLEALSSGRHVRNAYRLVDRLNLRGVVPQPNGPFTVADELTVLKNLRHVSIATTTDADRIPDPKLPSRDLQFELLSCCLYEVRNLWHLASTQNTMPSSEARLCAEECYFGKAGDCRVVHAGFAAFWKKLHRTDSAGWRGLLSWNLIQRVAALCSDCVSEKTPWVTSWSLLRERIQNWTPIPEFGELQAELTENLRLVGRTAATVSGRPPTAEGNATDRATPSGDAGLVGEATGGAAERLQRPKELLQDDGHKPKLFKGPLDIVLNLEERIATRAGISVRFDAKKKPWDIFLAVCRRHPHAYGKADLLNKIYGQGEGDEASLFAQVKIMRSLIRPLCLNVPHIRGVGYVVKEL
jgi:hypothetical protein